MAPFNPREHLIQLPRKLKDKATGQWKTVHDEYLEVKWRIVLFREAYPHQPSSQHPLLWWGVNSTVFGKHPLDQHPGPHDA